METDIDMNGHSINVPFLMTAKYNQNVYTIRAFFNGVTEATLPYDCILNEVLVDLKPNVKNDYQIIMRVLVIGKNRHFFNYTSTINSAQHRYTPTSFPSLEKYSKIEVWIWNKAGFIASTSTSYPITSDFANICLKFTTR